MIRRHQAAWFIGALTLAISGTALAVGPGSGDQTQFNVGIGDCHADSVTVRYELDSLMGEPTVKGSYRWEGRECRLPYSTVILLRVQHSLGSGYVKIDPVAPQAGAGFGYNATGSPDWSQALCTYSGTRVSHCLDAATAKEVWKHGQVTGFRVAW